MRRIHQGRSPTKGPVFTQWGILLGILLAYGEMILRLLSGKDLVDSVWPHAVRSLEWTLRLRESQTLTLSLFLLVGAAAFGLRTRVKSTSERAVWLALPYAALGLLLGLISLHFLLDVFYLRGAFLMLPTLMGWGLACLLIALGGPPTLRKSGETRPSATRAFHVLGVFFAAWLVMPGVPALAGFAPTPPAAPTMGYGSVPGPYTLEQYRSPYALPDEVIEVQGPLEDDVEFSVYVTLPHLPEELPISHLPLAVLLHGLAILTSMPTKAGFPTLVQKESLWPSSSTRPTCAQSGMRTMKRPTKTACPTTSNTHTETWPFALDLTTLRTFFWGRSEKRNLRLI